MIMTNNKINKNLINIAPSREQTGRKRERRKRAGRK